MSLGRSARHLGSDDILGGGGGIANTEGILVGSGKGLFMFLRFCY